jgi:hypothetical protein
MQHDDMLPQGFATAAEIIGDVSGNVARIPRRGGSWYRPSNAVSQLEMCETTASEVVDRAQLPIVVVLPRSLISCRRWHASAPGPTHARTENLVRQPTNYPGIQELDRLVGQILHRWIAHLGETKHRPPDGCLVQRQATRAQRQHQAVNISLIIYR